MSTINTPPKPIGELVLQTIAMPRDVNANGDISGGWLVSQMDLAAGTVASRRASGRTATVAMGPMGFMTSVPVGAIVSCYCKVEEVGRSSIDVSIEVWVNQDKSRDANKVTESSFIYVAIDDQGKTRSVD